MCKCKRYLFIFWYWSWDPQSLWTCELFVLEWLIQLWNHLRKVENIGFYWWLCSHSWKSTCFLGISIFCEFFLQCYNFRRNCLNTNTISEVCIRQMPISLHFCIASIYGIQDKKHGCRKQKPIIHYIRSPCAIVLCIHGEKVINSHQKTLSRTRCVFIK